MSEQAPATKTVSEAWPEAIKHSRGQLGQTYEVPAVVEAASGHLRSLGQSFSETLETVALGLVHDRSVLPAEESSRHATWVAPAALVQQVQEITGVAEKRQVKWVQKRQLFGAHRARADHSCPPASSACTNEVVEHAVKEF